MVRQISRRKPLRNRRVRVTKSLNVRKVYTLCEELVSSPFGLTQEIWMHGLKKFLLVLTLSKLFINNMSILNSSHVLAVACHLELRHYVLFQPFINRWLILNVVKIFVFATNGTKALISQTLILSVVFHVFEATNSQLVLKVHIVLSYRNSGVEAAVCLDDIAVTTGSVGWIVHMFSRNGWKNILPLTSLTVTYIDVFLTVYQALTVFLVLIIESSTILCYISITTCAISAIFIPIYIFAKINRSWQFKTITLSMSQICHFQNKIKF
jgi:hypothetical protein